MAFAWLGVLAISCAEGENNPGAAGTGGATISTSGAGGSAVDDGGPIDPGSDSSGITLIDGPPIGSVSDASFGDACASELHKAERRPLDMYIMLDSSDSMRELLSDNVTLKWDAVRKALTSFVSDMASTGLGVGLQYFPIVEPSVASTCAIDQACGQFGPCDIPMTCLGGTTVKPCKTAADCGGQQCVRLGICRRTGGLCAPAGAVCSMGAGPCDPAPGYCNKRDSCDANVYAAPAVEIGILPGAAQGIIGSLTAKMPDGLTPSSSALSGALAHAKAYAAAHPDHRVVVLLATDGLPTECTPVDIAGISALASGAASAMPAIATFVIGVFSSAEASIAQQNLDALATAGGTGKALIVNTSQDVTAGFLSALDTIRTNALSCEYAIPRPTSGQLDYGLVNVQFTSGGGQTSTIGYAGTACTGRGGWTYDVNPASGTPTKIVICDSTCNGFKADTQGSVSIQLGCKTIVIVN
jgi:hypothetical protein